MIVADASPLIVLAKLRRLELLHDLYGAVLIGPVVKAEAIDAGRLAGARDVDQLEGALADGRLRVVKPTTPAEGHRQRLMTRSRIHPGEAESIALARARGLRLVVDDREARNAAAIEGVDHVGTVGAMLEAYRQRHMDLGELETTVRDLSQILWLSPVVVAEVLRLAREAER
ncbi:MAG: hypothetical protein OXC12_20955 [Spirochaetaceae bacterium]|nr:hypothetical protein [Spirochaetaceae bacterium]